MSQLKSNSNFENFLNSSLLLNCSFFFSLFSHRYFQSNRVSMKSDVYSFGVVLLELVSGQPALIKSTNGITDHLINWVQPLIDRREIRGIVDPRLNGDFDISSAWKAVETAMACVRFSSIDRPTMSDIVYELKECVNC